MGSRGVLTKNYFIYPETVAEYGAEIERVMTETDRAMGEASEIIAKMASVTERIPSQIRSGELLELCETAQAEIRSFDFLSYGKRVNQGLLNLLDQNQYITENFIGKMRATTERMREFGAGCRRLTELIDYSGGSLPLKGLALSAVSNVESNDIDAGEENLTGQGEETEEATTREDAVLKGREVLLRRLEWDGKDPNEIDWICTYIQLCQPIMLTNLYITDCYSSVDANKIYDLILKYYNDRPDTPLYHTTENRISQISDFMPDYSEEIQEFLDAFERNEGVYIAISEKTNVPIEIIAIIHYREDTFDFINGNFNIDIRDGTEHPTYTETQFIDQAIDVFNDDYFQNFLNNKYSLYPGTNDVIGMLCFMEVYNGLVDSDQYLSPYIYSGTPLYESGKYTEDHVYDPDVVDRQMGAYCLLLALNGQINYDE